MGVTNIDPPPSSFGDIYLGVGANGEKVRLLVVHDANDGPGGKRILALSPSIGGRRIMATGGPICPRLVLPAS